MIARIRIIEIISVVVEISLVNYCRLGRRDELNEQMFDLHFIIVFNIKSQNKIQFPIV